MEKSHQNNIKDTLTDEERDKRAEKLLHENYTPEELAELDEMAQEFVDGLSNQEE